MSEKPFSISAQGIVVALLAVVALSWILFSPTKSKKIEETPVPDIAEQTVVETVETGEPVKPSDEPVEPVENWTTYHGGPGLHGVSNASIPDKPVVLWRFQSDSAVYQPPVHSNDLVIFASRKGGVYALDEWGNEVWSKRNIQFGTRRDGRPRIERFDAPISIHNETVFVGSLEGNLYALDVFTGNEKWKFFTDAPILGTANFYVTADGQELIYIINQSEGNLFAIDFQTGKEAWRSDFVAQCDGSPSVVGDKVVYGSCANALHIFSATDGTLLSEIVLDEDSQVASGVALVGDSVFSGAHSGRLFHADLNTGQIFWINESSEDEIFSTPAVNSSLVIFGSLDGFFYALDRMTGNLEWSFETDGIPVSPVIAGEKVIACSDGTLYLLDINTGKEIWSYEVSDEISSPGMFQDMILVGADDGTVTAFGTKDE
jgi:outer membrane protein assembly factor BamB